MGRGPWAVGLSGFGFSALLFSPSRFDLTGDSLIIFIFSFNLIFLNNS